MKDETDHHVAWADRIGLNKTWAKNILNCNEAFGTTGFCDAVECLHNSLINIRGDGPKLRKIADDYKNTTLETWKENTFNNWITKDMKLSANRGYKTQKQYDIIYESYKHLYTYIVQLLEDNGFCFYESNIEGDDAGLDD